ncbi:MAG TPA: diguanylate cyclase [Oculatellaceae cyanobacterium]|jgi:diguanylate cyclase (GGDEF)-like protein/PAS domain S-box-containing protein
MSKPRTNNREKLGELKQVKDLNFSQLVEPEQELKRQNQYLQLLGAIALKIRQSLELDEILQTTVTEVRQLLNCDRLLIYRLWADGTGSAVCEAVIDGLPQVLGITFPPEIFPEDYHQLYTQGRVKAIDDIQKAEISPCLVEFLSSFGVQAKLVVPIVFKQQLWGLFVAHQCLQPRNWNSFEIDLLKQIADHLGIAVAQAQLVEALRISEQRYALAMSATNEGVWDWNLKTNQVYFSPRWKAMLGYQEDEIGDTIDEWLNRVHPLSINQVKTQIYAYLEGLVPNFESEHPLLHQDGSYRWVLTRGIAQRGIDGIERLTGSVSDINDRKQAEQQLRLLESVVINANDAVLITEAEPVSKPGPRIIYVNQAFTRMTGYSLEEIKGKTPRLLQGPKTNRATLAKIRTALNSWQPVRVEIINYSKDGSEFWVELNISPVTDERGWYTHWISIQREITERKRLEELHQQQAEREQLIAQIGQRIRQSLNLEDILQTTVAEVREFLGCDRVLIYRVWSDGTGSAVKEAVVPGWDEILGRTFPAEVFPQEYHQLYCDGRIRAIADVEKDAIAPCLVEFLHELQVKAKLVVAILQGEKLWGLLIAHHCSAPRSWQQLEINLLSSLATQVAIAIKQSELYHKLQGANQELQSLASSDSLTNIGNRRCFDQTLEQEWLRLRREQQCLSLILCDIDCFKLYNDTYGHQAGDYCLQQVAKAISRAAKRPRDLAARYGGEEFAIVLPHTDLRGALRVAEEIRSFVQELKILHANSVVSQYVTLSLGVATTIPSLDSSATMLIAMADEALYQAKKQGRDRVVYL